MLINLYAGVNDYKAIVVGAGFAGLDAAKKFDDIGLETIILEKSSQLGGTWWHNR